ncbi:hypothetical protein [Reyranella sp.]|uniref:hypothetical protein n=1 Tax=Reyranella sp. TaxID=1929291 RepID=UPI00272142A0|nr:hypothetical protein [Reyranella sp.]MDO8972877.1 hypothetical protein [Reyranella sp.]MDZ4057708.1 hypothetical protein [Polynucleobacter sp.]
MAFIPVDFGQSFHAEVFRRGSSYYVLVRVGHDPDRETNYYVEVGLRPVPGCNYLEYHFCLIGAYPPDQEEYYWSGLDVPGDIPADCRKKVLDVVLLATENLLNDVRPEEVFRITRDVDVAGVVLAKHDAVSIVFDRCGYEVAQADVHHGKLVWMMRRKASAA